MKVKKAPSEWRGPLAAVHGQLMFNMLVNS